MKHADLSRLLAQQQAIAAAIAEAKAGEKRLRKLKPVLFAAMARHTDEQIAAALQALDAVSPGAQSRVSDVGE